MESAIPPHLAQARTRPSRLRAGWQPPYPAYVARFAPTVNRVVMAYLGVQYTGTGPTPAFVETALDELDRVCSATDGPGRLDRARCVDEADHSTIITIAYWDDPAAFDRWFAGARGTWLGDEHVTKQAGFFAEILRPSVSRFETLFSHDRREGVAGLAEELSGEVVEHAYWGGARDRLPVAQIDPLTPGGRASADTDGVRRRVGGQQNLCLIRSGQDWTDTDGEERRMYLDEVEPTLRAGMEFLRDEGTSVGCFANRYLRLVGPDGQLTEKSFGMSWWRCLDDLDRWAREHPTHLAIFAAAMKYLSTLGPAARLRLYHEVTVAAADEQYFEYLGCHPQTGMLRALDAVVDSA